MSNTEIVKEEDNEDSQGSVDGGRNENAENRTYITGMVDETNEIPVHEQSNMILNRCVNNIDKHFKKVLATHEKDFMAAYQGHMTKVKKELQFLKSKAEKAAGELSNDDTVTNLQKSIQWFQGEAKELNSILEDQKRDVQKLKTSRLNTMDDNKFLRNQVKDAMKHNKLLEVAENKTKKQCQAIQLFLDRNKNYINTDPPVRGSNSNFGVRKSEQNLYQYGEGDEMNDPYSQGMKEMKDRTEYNMDYVDMENETNVDEMDQDSQILANLNILQENMDHPTEYQMRQIKSPFSNGEEEPKTFFTSLPQTQEELERLSIDSADYQIKDYIKDLLKKNNNKQQAAGKIIKFFNAYDASRDLNILLLQKKLDTKKRENQKLRTQTAYDYAEKAEVENLFLDCIDQCKREHFKMENANNGLHMQGGNAASKKRIYGGDGVQLSLNGTISNVNLNHTGKNLKSTLINDNTALITLFQEMFGCNKAPMYETDVQGIDVQAANPFAISGGVSVGGRAGERNPSFTKSMQDFNYRQIMAAEHSQKGQQYASGNPLKMIKQYQTQGSNMLSGKGPAAGSISYGSNASTRDYHQNPQQEEMQRFNQIMQEPIENLIANMDQLSRPASSKQYVYGNKGLNTAVGGKRQKLFQAGSLRKERALTAGGNKTGLGRGPNGQILKIAQSAYHIQQNRPTTQGNQNAHTLTQTMFNNQQRPRQSDYNMPAHLQNQQSIQVVDGMVTLGGSSIPAGRVQSATHAQGSFDPQGYTMSNASENAYSQPPHVRAGNARQMVGQGQGYGSQARPVGGSMDMSAFNRPGMTTSGPRMLGGQAFSMSKDYMQQNYASGADRANTYASQTGGIFTSTNDSNRLNSATQAFSGHSGTRRKPNIRLGSGSGPSSNIFSVKNGKLQLTNKSSILQV